MTKEEAHAVLSANSTINPGSFYGGTTGLSLGTGLVFDDIRCPQYDPKERLYATYENCVYVLTHECDVDPGNSRVFSDYLVVCPLISIEAFIEEYTDEFKDDAKLRNFLTAVSRREVSRVIYLPPGPGFMEYGALIYLNGLVSTNVSEFKDKAPLTAVTVNGLRVIDQALQNHILRPKTQPLGLQAH